MSTALRKDNFGNEAIDAITVEHRWIRPEWKKPDDCIRRNRV
jgi:hypothetical protein